MDAEYAAQYYAHLTHPRPHYRVHWGDCSTIIKPRKLLNRSEASELDLDSPAACLHFTQLGNSKPEDLQELEMAMLASLLPQFGLDSSEHLVCFERLGVRRVEVCAPPYLSAFSWLVRFPDT